MDRLFVGKFKLGDQLEKNYYRIDTLDETFKRIHFGGIEIGDYILPVQKAEVSKLFRFIGFETLSGGIEARFEVIKLYDPAITLSNICFCKFIAPDMVLMNKAAKSTRGIGFHALQLEPNSPSIIDIDFSRDKRRYFVCLEKKLREISFFRPSDICVVISDTKEHAILDIVEYSGQEFRRHEIFWQLFLDKVGESGAQYTLVELLEFASPQQDGAKLKEGYLRAILSALDADSAFSVDNIVSLYDNIIVGRRRTPKKVGESEYRNGNDDVAYDEDDAADLEDLSAYAQYAKLLDFNPNIILHGPPGTGKTYGAMRIIEAFEQQNGTHASFGQVLNERRAKFITFHQAFSYEEFVEGIRPNFDDSDEKSHGISYEIAPGVLKKVAEDCRIQGKKKHIKNNALSNTTPPARYGRFLSAGATRMIYTKPCVTEAKSHSVMVLMKTSVSGKMQKSTRRTNPVYSKRSIARCILGISSLCSTVYEPFVSLVLSRVNTLIGIRTHLDTATAARCNG